MLPYIVSMASIMASIMACCTLYIPLPTIRLISCLRAPTC